MSEKIQYYASDLSYVLNIGEITDMHVATLDSGQQVLRIEYLPASKDEYKTVKARPGKSAPLRRKNSTGWTGPVKSGPPVNAKKLDGLGERISERIMDQGLIPTITRSIVGKNKDKPKFMEDAGY